MQVEQNKKAVRRFYEEVMGKGNYDVASEVFSDSYIRHDFRQTVAAAGPQGQKDVAVAFRAAFPDIKVKIDLLLGEGDYVIGRWTLTGTNDGPWDRQSPTGKKMVYSGCNIFRFQNGKVAEIWNHRDDLGLQEQLGVPIHAGTPPEKSTR